MKTVPKILLLFFAIAQLAFVLYISLPAIPKKIENEEPGDMYNLGPIVFNLSSDQYVENEEFLETLEERDLNPDEIVLLTNEVNNNSVVVFQVVTEDNKDLLEESFRVFSNPFLHRFSRDLVQKKMQSTVEESDGEQIKEIHQKVYRGNNKIALINTTTRSDDTKIFSADVKIDGLYYSILPSQQGENNELALENIMEFIRTVAVPKAFHQETQ